MKHIALLGFGTVGSGVAEVLTANEKIISERIGDKINVKYILDLRDFPGSPFADRIVHDVSVIINDPEIETVAEMMGGIHPAYDFSRLALEAGKNVVTSNKAVVAECGLELSRLARKNGVKYLFEASVGGGIPIIHPLCTDLAANEITGISGILNGTTNFILTEMAEKGIDFDEALAAAQSNGYAEADPTADIEGWDAARKIVILAALAYGRIIPVSAVKTRGIRRVTRAESSLAASFGCKIKLIASASLDALGNIRASVAPRFVKSSCPLSCIEGVFNGVSVSGNMLGDVLFYGRGAGKLPTASAVVSDVIEIITHPADLPARLVWSEPKKEELCATETESGRYVCIFASREDAEKHGTPTAGDGIWGVETSHVPAGDVLSVYEIFG